MLIIGIPEEESTPASRVLLARSWSASSSSRRPRPLLSAAAGAAAASARLGLRLGHHLDTVVGMGQRCRHLIIARRCGRPRGAKLGQRPVHARGRAAGPLPAAEPAPGHPPGSCSAKACSVGRRADRRRAAAATSCGSFPTSARSSVVPPPSTSTAGSLSSRTRSRAPNAPLVPGIVCVTHGAKALAFCRRGWQKPRASDGLFYFTFQIEARNCGLEAPQIRASVPAEAATLERPLPCALAERCDANACVRYVRAVAPTAPLTAHPFAQSRPAERRFFAARACAHVPAPRSPCVRFASTRDGYRTPPFQSPFRLRHR